MPPSLRERIYAFQGRALPGWLESQARYGAIDFHHTQAFSDELNYFPSIHFNVHGREPQGIVQEKDLSRLRNKVEDALRALIDPWSKKPVIQAVHRREQLFSGPHIYRAPDLLLDICLDGGYSYNLMPSSSAPVGTGAWRKLDTREYLDRKGRSLSGSHRPYGLFVAAGPRVPALGEIKASILDASAITIARTGEKLPAHLEGQLQSFVTTTSSSYKKAQPPQNTSSHTKHDEARVENRLRALGYID